MDLFRQTESDPAKTKLTHHVFPAQLRLRHQKGDKHKAHHKTYQTAKTKDLPCPDTSTHS